MSRRCTLLRSSFQQRHTTRPTLDLPLVRPLTTLIARLISFSLTTTTLAMGAVRWKPTSAEELEEVEAKLLSFLKKPFIGKFVDIGAGWGRDTNQVWTIEMQPTNASSKKMPLVLLHGFGCGAGIWALNMEKLSAERRVMAIDILGFGRSSRPRFSRNEEAESELVDSIERWRSSIGLDEPFILLGHSFGGYLCMAYALKYPQHLAHVILADPWGMPSPETGMRERQIVFPLWAKVLVRVVFKTFNPLASIRAAGPWGPGLMRKARPDIQRKFEPLTGESESFVIMDYVYHCNAQSNPAGEIAFKNLSSNPAFAKNPIIDRLHQLDPKVNVSVIHGGNSWMFRQPEQPIRDLCPERVVEVEEIEGAGHHVYADNLQQFNHLVNQFCDRADQRRDLKQQQHALPPSA